MSSPFLDSSVTLIDFFEETYLPQLLENAPPEQVKQFRNAIGRATLLLGHAATLGDLVDPSFAKSFVEDLVQRGFTINRAEAFASCLRQVRDAAREERRVRSKESMAKGEAPVLHRPNVLQEVAQFLEDHPRSISAAFASILEADDQICSHSL